MKKREYFMEKKPARAIALLPIGVFLVLYLGLGCLFEYGLKIEMGFLQHSNRRGVSGRDPRRLPAEPGAVV